MFKHKIFAAFAVVSLFGLAACGGSSTDKKEGTVTTLAQKNAALSFTTLPATTAPRTVTTPMPLLPKPGPATTKAPAPPTTKPSIVPTTVPKTVTTPMPTLPKR